MKLFAFGIALACILALGDAQSVYANDAFLTDSYARPIFTQIQSKSFPIGSNLTNWLPELKIWSDGHIVMKFYDPSGSQFQMAVAQISSSQIAAFTVKLNQVASQLPEYRGNIKDVGSFMCIRVENSQRRLVSACNYTGSSTTSTFHSTINMALDLVRPIRSWAMLVPHSVLVTRVTSQCHYMCSNHPYSDTPITESGTWVSSPQLAYIFLQSIGAPSYVFVDSRGAGSFQVSVHVPGLSVVENVVSAPHSVYTPPNPTSSSGPNLALIIPLALFGGIAFIVFVSMIIYHRCKTTRKDSSYSVVETTAMSNVHYPAQDVPMDTFGSSPSPMLATAPTATVVPSNYAMPTYMVSSGAGMPQYYMVSSPGNGGGMPMYTQPVQGGYILTYMPAQTNQ